MIDGDGSAADKQGLLEALLADEHQFEPGDETVEWCTCGYPAAKVKKTGVHEPLADMLGFEQSSSNAKTYHCPSCGARRTTVAA